MTAATLTPDQFATIEGYIRPEDRADVAANFGVTTRVQRAFPSSLTLENGRFYPEVLGMALPPDIEAGILASLSPGELGQLATALDGAGHHEQANRLRAPQRFGRMKVINNTTTFPKPTVRKLGPLGMPRGEVSVLAGPPGSSKSTLMIMQAIAVATGRDDILGPIGKPGNVLIVSCEDPLEEVDRRFLASFRQHGVATSTLVGQIGIIASDEPTILFARDQRGGPVRPTAAFRDLLAIAAAFGSALIIIDTLASVAAGIDENAVGDMQVVMSGLRELARATGAVVVVLHHTAKGATGEDMNALRGSSALIGSARHISILLPMSEGEAAKRGVDPRHHSKLAVVKNSYGPRPDPIWFERRGVDLPAIDPDDPTIPVSVSAPVLIALGTAGPGTSAAAEADIDGQVLAKIIAAEDAGQTDRLRASRQSTPNVWDLAAGVAGSPVAGEASIRRLEGRGLIERLSDGHRDAKRMARPAFRPTVEGRKRSSENSDRGSGNASEK